MKLVLATIATLTLLLALACTAANEQALGRMTADQHSYVNGKIGSLRPGMGEREVTQLLGPPVRGKGSPRICYQAPGEPGKSEVCVRFELYKARYVEWLDSSGEGFRYFIDLKAPKEE